jgi:hypothetical protein
MALLGTAVTLATEGTQLAGWFDLPASLGGLF